MKFTYCDQKKQNPEVDSDQKGRSQAYSIEICDPHFPLLYQILYGISYIRNTEALNASLIDTHEIIGHQ